MTGKDWLPPMLRAWAYAWQAINLIDASLPSVLGRIREEGEGAAQGTFTQKYGEVYRGEALAIARALHGAPWTVRGVIAAHYLLPFPPLGPAAEVKATALGIGGRQDYYRALDAAYSYLAGRLDAQREMVNS